MLSSRILKSLRQIGNCLKNESFVQRKSFLIESAMPKSKEYVSSDDESSRSSEEEKAQKRKHKPEKKVEQAQSSKKPKKSNEEAAEPSWELGKNKFVKVREFKGKLYVDIREMYMDKDTGDLKPGKKGICLDMPQWRKLMEHVEEVDKVAKARC